MSAASPDPRAIDALLGALLELPPEARAAFLADADASPQVRAAVARLLAHEARLERFLSVPAAEFAASLIAHVEVEQEPGVASASRVGPYRVIREIGHGGMGTVYLGERDDEHFRQTVALKLVRGGLGDEALVRRFREERQILASLEHPRIARLIDGGLTPDGVPWLAMEYVEGTPIDRYCERHALGVEQRIELFCVVCEAVQYAHRQLVVHRDLKPSNILVTEDGQPKLLDFGIAKLLAPGAASPAEPTRTGAGLMTPEYASPEQVRGARVTTASDVYSLGVLLYKLLAGRHPFGLPADAPPHELARATLETEPERPSLAARRAHLPDSRRAGRGSRVLGAERLRRRLSGDLDAVVMTALRKEPERRYPSAAALAEDLRRHLAGLPVRARPDTRRYRAGKFVRRHGLAVMASALVVLSLLGGLVGTTWQARAAVREAERAEQVKEFLVSLFRAADPAVARGREITAQELLERGAERLEAELARQPELQAELLAVLGSTYLEIGQLEAADALLRRALTARLRLHGPAHLATLAVRAQLGAVHKERGEYDAAESVLREVLAQRRRLGARGQDDVAKTLASLAGVLRYQGRYDEGRQSYEEALAIEREIFGGDHLEVAETLNGLGVLLEEMGALAEAVPVLVEALRIYRAQLPADHPDLLTGLYNLANARISMGEYAEGEALTRQVLELRRRIYRGDHSIVAVTLSNLAVALDRQGKYDEAFRYDREGLEMRRRLFGDDHPEVAASANNLGVRAYRTGDLDAAGSWLAEALRIWRITLPAEHPRLGTAINNVGAVLSERGEYGAAEPLLEEGLELRRRTFPAEHAEVAQSLRNLGILMHRTGRHEEAERNLAESLRVTRATLPPGHTRYAEVQVAYGELLIELRRSAEAEPLLREALAIRREKLEPTDWRTYEAATALGHALAQLRRFEEAEPLLRESVAALTGVPGPAASRSRRTALEQLAALYTAQGRPAEARRMLNLLRQGD